MLKTPPRLSALGTDFDVLAVERYLWSAAAEDATEAGVTPSRFVFLKRHNVLTAGPFSNSHIDGEETEF